MSVYVDEPFHWPHGNTRGEHARRVSERHGGMWCHLWCDPGEEKDLHRIARKLGLKSDWFQRRKDFPHYDIVAGKRDRAIELGAQPFDLKKWWYKRITGKTYENADEH